MSMVRVDLYDRTRTMLYSLGCLQNMHHLLDLLEAPDPDTIEKFLSSLPMIFDVGSPAELPWTSCQACMHSLIGVQWHSSPAGMS